MMKNSGYRTLVLLGSFLLIASCKDKTLPAPVDEKEPYTGADTSFWSSGEVLVYEGNFHRIDSKHVYTNGSVDIYEFYKERNEHRQYLVKKQDDTIYLTFNKYFNATTALKPGQLDADGYYKPNQFDSYKFVGDTMFIKGTFRYNDYQIGRIMKINEDYKGLLQP